LDKDDGSLDQNDTTIYCRRLMQFCDTPPATSVIANTHRNDGVTWSGRLEKADEATLSVIATQRVARCAPDDRLREAIHASPSLRAQRSNPVLRHKAEGWIASSLRSSQ
jgi:hypothetical protein